MACPLGCEVCLTNFSRICEFRKHVKSRPHVEKMKEVFQMDNFSTSGGIPFIVVLDLSHKQKKTPVIGLSLVTFCFSLKTNTCFYLCHVCGEKCPSDRIANHLFSGDHHTNYFSYTDPDKLRFSWIPSTDKRLSLIEKLTTEVNNSGPGQLQVLDLPVNLLEKLENRRYSEVMSTLRENNKLLKNFEAVMPKRMMIQTYQRDSSRKHPLLGMQHIVECISVGFTEERHYLCTLCQLPLGVHMIIKHVLSFDHIYCYFVSNDCGANLESWLTCDRGFQRRGRLQKHLLKPDYSLSDGGCQFVSSIFEATCRSINVSHKLTTAHNTNKSDGADQLDLDHDNLMHWFLALVLA